MTDRQVDHETGDEPDRVPDRCLDDFEPVKSGSRDHWVQSEEPDFDKPGPGSRDRLLRE